MCVGWVGEKGEKKRQSQPKQKEKRTVSKSFRSIALSFSGSAYSQGYWIACSRSSFSCISTLSLSLEREGAEQLEIFLLPGVGCLRPLFIFLFFIRILQTRNKNDDEGGYSRDSKNQNNKKKSKTINFANKKNQQTNKKQIEAKMKSSFFLYSSSSLSLFFKRFHFLFLFVLCLFVIFFWNKVESDVFFLMCEGFFVQSWNHP